MANGALDLQLVWFKNTKMMIVFDPLDRAEAMEHPRRDPPIFLAKCQLSWKGLVNFSIVTVYVEGFLPSPVGLWVEQLRYNCRGMGYWEQRIMAAYLSILQKLRAHYGIASIGNTYSDKCSY
ncbi:PREDICTED: fasciclin arabinogalactan 20 [Prunus dulcis]|uniref:PREDICTED: fasciclin arabinogalactan 20 n=1 Tax=Prunus dulcis TaxID=3755 RepID=A0A5E4EY03_PRUDU|nr:PREDICTED: fasciclin arabinogalactan 20 [Prunus dulcis]